MTAVHIGLFIVGSLWALGIIPAYLLFFSKKEDEYEKYERIGFSFIWPLWFMLTGYMWVHYKVQDWFK